MKYWTKIDGFYRFNQKYFYWFALKEREEEAGREQWRWFRDVSLQIEAEADNTRRSLNVERICKKYNLGFYRKLAEDSLFNHPPAVQYMIFYMDRFVERRSYLTFKRLADTREGRSRSLIDKTDDSPAQSTQRIVLPGVQSRLHDLAL